MCGRGERRSNTDVSCKRGKQRPPPPRRGRKSPISVDRKSATEVDVGSNRKTRKHHCVAGKSTQSQRKVIKATANCLTTEARLWYRFGTAALGGGPGGYSFWGCSFRATGESHLPLHRTRVWHLAHSVGHSCYFSSVLVLLLPCRSTSHLQASLASLLLYDPPRYLWGCVHSIPGPAGMEAFVDPSLAARAVHIRGESQQESTAASLSPSAAMSAGQRRVERQCLGVHGTTETGRRDTARNQGLASSDSPYPCFARASGPSV